MAEVAEVASREDMVEVAAVVASREDMAVDRAVEVVARVDTVAERRKAALQVVSHTEVRVAEQPRQVDTAVR